METKDRDKRQGSPCDTINQGRKKWLTSVCGRLSFWYVLQIPSSGNPPAVVNHRVLTPEKPRPSCGNTSSACSPWASLQWEKALPALGSKKVADVAKKTDSITPSDHPQPSKVQPLKSKHSNSLLFPPVNHHFHSKFPSQQTAAPIISYHAQQPEPGSPLCSSLLPSQRVL